MNSQNFDILETLKTAVDATSQAPIYKQIRQEITHAIEKGKLSGGAVLPSERDIAETLSISRMTARKAINGLCKSGLLIRKQGAKTIIAPRLEKSVSKLSGFSQDMQERGFIPSASWLIKAIDFPTGAEALALGMITSESIVRLERLRSADDIAVAIERAIIPQSILPDPELVQTSLYATLEKLGHRPTRGIQRMRSIAATKKDAMLLNCEHGTPVLCIERRCFNENNICVEFTETRYLGSAYDFVTELQA